jgi:hypothetical protein
VIHSTHRQVDIQRERERERKERERRERGKRGEREGRERRERGERESDISFYKGWNTGCLTMIQFPASVITYSFLPAHSNRLL